MKKLFKVLLIIVLILTAAVMAVVLSAGRKASHYYDYSNPVGEIEKEYTAMGDEKVSCKEFDAGDENIKKFAVWYPAELQGSARKYPVVLWANGTGSKSETYKYFLTHLASWGFIAVGNDDENTRTGDSLEAALTFLLAENENPDSVFYQKVDPDNIGIGGHSQGGAAVFNMVTNQEHGSMIKTVYSVSATSSYHTAVFGDEWEYDVSKINVPTFLTAGTGTFDAGTAAAKEQVSDEKAGIMQGICPLWSLEENYGLLPDTIDKVYARKTGVDHGDSYLQFDGYMTAWFRYYLAGDSEAGKAFYGEQPEIAGNSQYQDVKISME